MISIDELYKIGVFNGPHGVHGELSFTFTDDIFDRAGAEYLIVPRDGIPVPFFIESCRFRSARSALIRLEGVDSQQKAAAFTQAEVYLPRELARQHSDGEPASCHYFVGFRVEDERLGYLGTVEFVDDSTVNVLFGVQREAETVLVPAHEEFIVRIDAEARLLHTRLPEGLVGLNASEKGGNPEPE